MRSFWMTNFTEAQLEQVFIDLLKEQGYHHHAGSSILRNPDEVIIEEDLRHFLSARYGSQGITQNEVSSIILSLKTLPQSDLYESNKQFMNMISDGFILKREDRNKKDLYIQLLDYSILDKQIEPHHDQ